PAEPRLYGSSCVAAKRLGKAESCVSVSTPRSTRNASASSSVSSLRSAVRRQSWSRFWRKSATELMRASEAMAARVSPLGAWREWYTSRGQIGSHERGVLMKQLLTRAIVVAALAISSLVASQSVGYASGPTVSGGGVVYGDLGMKSQLGFTASSSGGQFLCVMAGRSGGFPFGPWSDIQQMHVQGNVTPGSLSIA